MDDEYHSQPPLSPPALGQPSVGAMAQLLKKRGGEGRAALRNRMSFPRRPCGRNSARTTEEEEEDASCGAEAAAAPVFDRLPKMLPAASPPRRHSGLAPVPATALQADTVECTE